MPDLHTRKVIHAPPRRVIVRRLALLVAAALAALVLAQLWLFPWFRGWLDAATPAQAPGRVGSAIVAMSVLSLIGAVWAAWEGGRILAARQWPVPGAFVLRDTPIETGASVRVRGLVLLVLGMLLAGVSVYGVALPFLLGWLG